MMQITLFLENVGVPIHFHSSTIPASALKITFRIRAITSPRQSPVSRISLSTCLEASMFLLRQKLLQSQIEDFAGRRYDSTQPSIYPWCGPGCGPHERSARVPGATVYFDSVVVSPPQ